MIRLQNVDEAHLAQLKADYLAICAASDAAGRPEDSHLRAEVFPGSTLVVGDDIEIVSSLVARVVAPGGSDTGILIYMPDIGGDQLLEIDFGPDPTAPGYLTDSLHADNSSGWPIFPPAVMQAFAAKAAAAKNPKQAAKEKHRSLRRFLRNQKPATAKVLKEFFVKNKLLPKQTWWQSILDWFDDNF